MSGDRRRQSLAKYRLVDRARRAANARKASRASQVSRSRASGTFLPVKEGVLRLGRLSPKIYAAENSRRYVVLADALDMLGVESDGQARLAECLISGGTEAPGYEIDVLVKALLTPASVWTEFGAAQFTPSPTEPVLPIALVPRLAELILGLGEEGALDLGRRAYVNARIVLQAHCEVALETRFDRALDLRQNRRWPSFLELAKGTIRFECPRLLHWIEEDYYRDIFRLNGFDRLAADTQAQVTSCVAFHIRYLYYPLCVGNSVHLFQRHGRLRVADNDGRTSSLGAYLAKYVGPAATALHLQHIHGIAMSTANFKRFDSRMREAYPALKLFDADM